MAVPLLANFLCKNKNADLTEKLQTRISSLIREQFTLADETLVYVGLTAAGHGLIFIEFVNRKTGLHELHTVELTKDIRGNHRFGASSGDPVYIGTKDVTDEGFNSIELCSQPFILTEEQRKKFSKALCKEAKQRQYYNVSGDHSIYLASYSGFNYASCLSFVTSMLRKTGLDVHDNFTKDVVQLPKHLKEKFKMSQPGAFQKEILGEEETAENQADDAAVEEQITERRQLDVQQPNSFDEDDKDREIASLKQHIKQLEAQLKNK